MAIWGIRAKRLKKKADIPNRDELEYITAVNMSGELVRFWKKDSKQIFTFNEDNKK